MKAEIRKRLVLAALDIDRVAFEREIKNLTDAELLAILDDPDTARFRMMSDEDLEVLISGSLKARR